MEHYISEHPCIVFARLNVSDPRELALFMHWLWFNCLPRLKEELPPIAEDFAAHQAVVEATPYRRARWRPVD